MKLAHLANSITRFFVCQLRSRPDFGNKQRTAWRDPPHGGEVLAHELSHVYKSVTFDEPYAKMPRSTGCRWRVLGEKSRLEHHSPSCDRSLSVGTFGVRAGFWLCTGGGINGTDVATTT